MVSKDGKTRWPGARLKEYHSTEQPSRAQEAGGSRSWWGKQPGSWIRREMVKSKGQPANRPVILQVTARVEGSLPTAEELRKGVVKPRRLERQYSQKQLRGSVWK